MKRQWFHILLSLTEGATHGAEIQRRVHERTASGVKLYPVTLYRSLDELVNERLIEELPEPKDAEHNERRRYFALTTQGRQALRTEARAMEAAAKMALDALRAGRIS
jgi:DNA-binding PadR family transcriptional regulator